jgi:hypothetical protein
LWDKLVYGTEKKTSNKAPKPESEQPTEGKKFGAGKQIFKRHVLAFLSPFSVVLIIL